ncbi:MAG: efflux RND transporter periplasmic adaptor subunit [Candidatus Dadabacteria bacterium]|nr:MAG: efflux RND transporter periplasmic adaptor subunit [Candidatus Dadabacteria bacterium]
MRHAPRHPYCLVLAAALGAGLTLAACGGGHHEPRRAAALPAARVRVAPVDVRTRTATEHVPGTVRAKRRATIEAKVSGRILELPVAPGDHVHEGDLLVRLDAHEIQAQLEQARARLAQAERDRKRFAALLARQAVTQRQYDEVLAAYEVARAAVSQAETMAGYTTIKAPFDAVVVRKLAEVGDLASPGKPLLVIEDPHGYEVAANLSESLITRVRLGQHITVTAPGLEREIDAVVSEIAPAADPATRTFLVKFDLPDPSGLRSGQFVRVLVPVGQVTAPHVPKTAVVRRGQLEMVFVASGSRAHMRLVKTGKPSGDEIEILSGLAGDEQVVVEGAATLTDGQPILAE